MKGWMGLLALQADRRHFHVVFVQVRHVEFCFEDVLAPLQTTSFYVADLDPSEAAQIPSSRALKQVSHGRNGWLRGAVRS